MNDQMFAAQYSQQQQGCYKYFAINKSRSYYQ
jgi:hypothetical protein